MRNVLIAVGNSGEPALLSDLTPYLSHQEPLLRGAAIWALSCLATRTEIEDAHQKLCHSEKDETVLAEWQDALRKV